MSGGSHSIRLEGALYKIILLVASFSSLVLLIGTRSMIQNVNFIRCIDRVIEFTERNILLLGSAIYVLTEIRWEFMEQKYRKPIQITRLNDTLLFGYQA